MRVPYVTVDVFTDRPFGGNPLAVFPDARRIPEALLQPIAGELNLSETVFVFPAETPQGTRRARIFTPSAELPFAGHPTVGTAFMLVHRGDVPSGDEGTTVVLEEGVGLVSVRVDGATESQRRATFTAAQLPEEGPQDVAAEELAAIVGLEASDLAPAPWRPRSFSAGVPFLHIPLASLEALSRARLDSGRWQQLADSWASQLYLVVPPGLDGDPSSIRVRMFAPGLGVPEDPATGSAATALAGYLAATTPFHGSRSWVVLQGQEIGRPSEIHLEVEGQGSVVSQIKVGGTCVPMAEAWLEIPDRLVESLNA
ncbi:MAG: PhzF family phenazine biosynthesis protein [Acidobacteriota bacterium]